ncbi:hypothetical protein QQZ08_001147 [Neonectria magnoliae]|uniref:SGNH hydrolase-type esterase domain-containing protein n=1 Tax=Neonectria magnoliae TaxID=2732573 RepID=A0ABR1IGS0_9HYPO
MGWMKTILVTACAIASLSEQASALPSSHVHSHAHLHNHNNTHPFEAFGPIVASRADKVPLRILSLGASIMSGTGGASGNGARKPLRDALRYDGWEVNMVGSRGTGKMQDWNHEATPGHIIDEARVRLKLSIGYKPNIVIINLGTNDANRNIDANRAGARLNGILDDIWAADGMSKTCVILSTVLDSMDPTGRVVRLNINAQYRQLVKNRAAEEKCIYLADMDPPAPHPASGWIKTWEDYDQGEDIHVHPNDNGYLKLGYIFYKAINKAADDGRLVKPGDFGSGSTACDKFEGVGMDAGGLTQRGSGNHDGIYYHNSEEKGIRWTWDSDSDRNQWRFARLFNRNYDDIVGWFNEGTSKNYFGVWANSANGQGSFTKLNDLDPKYYCDPRGIYFIDMNADGLDDFVCIQANGDAYLSVNMGDGNRAGGKSPTFRHVGKIKSNEGADREHVVMADIDGDGRGDYGTLDGSGNVRFWRNGWVNDMPQYWQDLGRRFSNTGLGSFLGVRFEDINGDGRDNAMWMGTDGKTYTWTNARSCKKGSVGDGLNVAWRQAFFKGASSGPTHVGMAGYVKDDDPNLRKRIHFARIYGQSSVFGNLPLQDYVFIEHVKLASGKHRFNMRVWKNVGGGGTKLVADGNKYCNMAGHRDGRVDYVWTQSTGEMTIFINRGKGTIGDSDAGGYWDFSQGVIFRPPRNMDRRDLHLKDWDGDGDCDIIYVNPETNAVEVFLNQYPQTGKWEWTHLTNPAPGLTCKYKRGLATFDLSVRFAGLTGNSRADYLCIAPDGTVSGYLHQDNGGFVDAGQIKFAVGKDRANLRWADVDGDGLEDMLWIEKFSGDTWVWYNGGRGSPSTGGGSSFYWRVQEKKAFYGLVAGTCIYYADLDGNQHAFRRALRLGHVQQRCQNFTQPVVRLGGPQYSITILLQMLRDSLARYDEIMADGYDKYFGIYSDYLVDNAWSALRNYLLAHGDEYFTCKITEETACCNTCDFEHISCNWCTDPCKIDSAYDDGHGWANTSQPCPPDYSKRGMNDNDEKTIYWSLRDDKADEFWASLAGEVGAPKDKLSITKRQQIGTLDASCARAAVTNGPDHMPESCYYRNHWFDAPEVKGFDNGDVVNPKTILNKALSNAKPLIDQLSASLFEIQAMSWEVDPEDIVDSVSMSILLIRDSVDFMETVVEMGKELEESAKKSFILNLLSAIFLVVSMGGSTLAAAGLTALGRAFVVIGEGGSIGLGIYDMVETPGAIPLDLFGILLSVKGIRDVGNARKAAKARRSMPRADISRISTKVAANLDQIALVSRRAARGKLCVRFA